MKTFVFIVLLSFNLGANSLGSLLFHGNCITCHNETKDISAPSMIHVREVYKSAFIKKEDFVKYMSEWVMRPDAKTSLMDGSIKKYELMPLLGYEMEALKDITAFIYDTDFTKEHEGHKY